MRSFPKWSGLKRMVAVLTGVGLAVLCADAATTNMITVSVLPAPVNTFSPYDALGAGVDALFGTDPTVVYSKTNVTQMLAAGHGALTYRLNTELGVADWHWNPTGTWSDTNGGGQGYFTGSSATNAPLILHSYEYELPHRGFTDDPQGNTRYSRLTDGDASTYWKSNPYLTSGFTGESDALHPQWVMVDLGAGVPINAVRIQWGNPYATSYRVQYWNGFDDPTLAPASGNWVDFASGVYSNATGGDVTNLLTAVPSGVQFMRVLMTASSSTCDNHGNGDVRNCVGYAIKEISVGTLVDGIFDDVVTHSPDANQTATYVSSVDPWHAASSLVAGLEQVGLDFVFTNGITRGLPAMVPVSLLYGTPSNAVAEIKYLKARGYPLSYVELGEEPDGQFVTPEDYGALYLQWAAALHAVDPALKLGGPAFQEGNLDVKTWPDGAGETSWLKRFINYLSAHGRLADLSFMSFEHYPFDPCGNPWSTIDYTPLLINNSLGHWRADGLPSAVPIFCTEYNYSSDHSGILPDLPAALWQADFVGSFLTAGGAAAFYYQYEPLALQSALDCDSWGSFSMFTVNATGQILARTAQFYSTEMICQFWAQPGRLPHYIFPAHSDLLDLSGLEMVTAYALVRPDGRWSLMLINKDNTADHYVQVQFSNTTTTAVSPLFNPVDVYQYGTTQYVWHAASANGSASPNLPPTTKTVTNTPVGAFLLPAASLTVLRAAGPPVLDVNANLGVTNDCLVLDYFRAAATNGVTYLPEIATNLGTWLSGTQYVQQTVLSSNAAILQIRARDLIPLTNGTKGYLGLKISSP